MAKPFFKWCGGKASLVPQLLELLPPDADKRRHVEPFLGGGALFFAREPKQAMLGDLNSDLIIAYISVCNAPQVVCERLSTLLELHTPEGYYALRKRYNETPPPTWMPGTTVFDTRACEFLYLNKTCYNGLYRTNRKGAFNVPCGKHARLVADATVYLEAARCLQAAQLVAASYERLLAKTTRRDFVYLDPPYDGTFNAYTKDSFEQVRLAERFKALGTTPAMLSTSDTPLIRKLYKGYNITEVVAQESIGGKGVRRGKVHELVIRNYGG